MSDGERFCGSCGGSPNELVEDPESVAKYEAVLADFAVDGVLEDWEEDELALQRQKLSVSVATHEALKMKYQPLREVLPVGLEVDQTTVREFVVGSQGVIRARVVNGGSRPLRNVTVRFVTPGVAVFSEHAVRILRPRGDEVLLAALALDKPGQFAVSFVLRCEDMDGNSAYFRADALPYRVAREAGAGPQSVQVNLDASSMRVAGDPLVNIGSSATSSTPRGGGVLTDTKWVALRLGSISAQDWTAWEEQNDGGRRAAAELAAPRADVRDLADAAPRAELVTEAQPVSSGGAARTQEVPTSTWLARALDGARTRGREALAGASGAIANIGYEAKTLLAARNDPQPAPPASSASTPSSPAGTGANQYFLMNGAQRVGPITFEDVRRAVQNGQLLLNTPVWRHPMLSASPAASIPELAPLFQDAGPGLRQAWMASYGRDGYGAWATASIAGVECTFRYCPAGRFTMGAPATEVGRWDDEGPQHEVVLTRGFWLGQTPVTQRLWYAVTAKNPSRNHGADRPVEMVSWADCNAFAARVNAAMPGLDLRLPTEAEWEYACRAGTTTPTYSGPNDAQTLDAIAWFDGNSAEETHPVGLKLPNAAGLYDMLGNVHEWCSDWVGAYSNEKAEDPIGAPSGVKRTFRGGAWNSGSSRVRSAYRGAERPEYTSAGVGLRLARHDPSAASWEPVQGTRGANVAPRERP